MLAENFEFEGHLATFGARNEPKSKNIAQIFPKLIWRSPEYEFFDPQIGQNTCANLAKKVDFCVYFRYTSPIFGLVVLKKNSSR